ncbi:MAG: L,D-transpeptidase family protein [Geobacter sp.]
MFRIIRLLSLPATLRRMAFLAMFAALQGCATMTAVYEEFPSAAGEQEETFEQNEFSVARGEDLIGRLRSVRLEQGDTLPDIARHYGLGLNSLTAANPGVDIWLPEDGKRLILPHFFILPDTTRKGVVINLATMRLFAFKDRGDSLSVVTYPVGVGTEDRPSPTGQMRVERKAYRPSWYVPASIAKAHLKKGDVLPAVVPPGPDNPLGEYALYLSAPSYLIHGTNKPASIGLRASNGCFRLYPEDVKRLYGITPAKTPVNIINQPYLVGLRNGVIYLEVHGPAEELDQDELDKVYRKLKAVETASGRPLDWNKVKQVLAEARGIPVPVFEIRPGSASKIMEPTEVRHPTELRYKPKLAELTADAWSVLVAELQDETDAARLAAIINHQGPHIPARMVSKGFGYQVIAGPFSDQKEAREIIRRLKMDLELDARLVEPARR